MKFRTLIFILFCFCFLSNSCKKESYDTNGETIYRTGRNKSGDKLLNKGASKHKFIGGCQDCHGKNRTDISTCVIKYSDLTDSGKHAIPYTDSLIIRFLDEELKSDGTAAKTGVVWQMNVQDKTDLINFLKTL